MAIVFVRLKGDGARGALLCLFVEPRHTFTVIIDEPDMCDNENQDL